MPSLKTIGIILGCWISILQNSYGQDETVVFNRDVRPILSDRCFLCHGPDRASEQGKATDLRLDDRASAIEFDIFVFLVKNTKYRTMTKNIMFPFVNFNSLEGNCLRSIHKMLAII